jgi:threonine dehydrogenase-like Zn-dependent dehydrogenase
MTEPTAAGDPGMPVDPASGAVILAGGQAKRLGGVDKPALVVDGRIRARELLTHTFPLAEFGEALATFNERRDGALKVIVEP